MGFQLEGVSMYDSGKWMLRIRHQNSWVIALFDVVVTHYDVTTDADLNISIEVNVANDIDKSSKNPFPGR